MNLYAGLARGVEQIGHWPAAASQSVTRPTNDMRERPGFGGPEHPLPFFAGATCTALHILVGLDKIEAV